MGRLPQFIMVGPPRTATTRLDQVFRGHVGLPVQTKETHFFSRNYGRGLEWYSNHFHGCSEELVLGEVCASYFENPAAPRRISHHIPGCRIICTIRNPVDRLYSYYKLMRHNGKTALPFEQAVHRHPKMLEFNRYATLIRRWQDQFGEENVLVMLNDDLYRDEQDYVDRITSFIGTERICLCEKAGLEGRRNEIGTAPRNMYLARAARGLRSWLGANQFYGARRVLDRVGFWRLCCEGGAPFPPVDEDVRSRLQGLLRHEIDELEIMLGRTLTNWKE